EAAYLRIQAQRQVWQQRGELSRITSETLLDAASTYIDLLAARTGEAIGQEQLRYLQGLLERAEKVAATVGGAKVQVARVGAEISSRRQTVVTLQEQARAASAKLAYLLGLDPCVELVPVDEVLLALPLVDASRCTADLVAQALTTGPGVRELEGLLALVHRTM